LTERLSYGILFFMGISATELDIFCKELETHGSVPAAARAIGRTSKDILTIRKDQVHIDERIIDSLDQAAAKLEKEAMRRAVDGVEEPVYYQGERVDSITKFSDPLLKTMLQANLPDKYRDRIDANVTGDITVLIKGFGKLKKEDSGNSATQ